MPIASRDGDVVLALASSGLHSNGYSLVRHIVVRAGIRYGDNAPDFGTTWGEALLEPTRLYTQPLLRLIAERQGAVHALSHVTGGGIAANLARVLPQGLWVEVDRSTWSPPPVFRVLADLGELDLESTEGTWNLGIGFLAVVAADKAQAAASALSRDGHRHLAGRRRPQRRIAPDGDFEQGAKGVDGGAVRLVGSYSDGSTQTAQPWTERSNTHVRNRRDGRPWRRQPGDLRLPAPAAASWAGLDRHRHR